MLALRAGAGSDEEGQGQELVGRIPGFAKDQCIKLFEKVLRAKALREYAGFDFLRGDPTPKRPRGVKLPVDAYFPDYSLVVEYMGEQHFMHNPLMNRRPGRREQRPRYQERRLEVLPKHSVKVIRVRYDEQLTEELAWSKLREVRIEGPDR